MTEPMLLGLIGFLSLLLIAQQAFFLFNIHRLINKVMSKNFAEYSTVLNKPERPQFQVQLPNDEDEFNNDLNALNGLVRQQ